MLLQPEPVLKDDGYYDALSLGAGIGIGQVVTDFAVSFDWLGDAVMPGRQFYEIIDPVTFETIDSGYTVPEPASAVMVFGGWVLLGLQGRHESRRREVASAGKPATILLFGLGSLALKIRRKT